MSAPAVNTSEAHLLEAFPSNAEALLQNVTMGSGNVTANDLLSALGTKTFTANSVTQSQTVES